jgi:hypothetical protein
MDRPIVVTEYPKSGGSWLTSLIGDALHIPKRDIYVQPGFNLFDTSHHPWYEDAAAYDFPEKSVIKSHELPASNMIGFDAAFVHLVRDGRDVIVSRWFFDKDFLVRNGITQEFNIGFDDYVEKTAREWQAYVTRWAHAGTPTVRYEDFLAAPELALSRLIETVAGSRLPDEAIQSAVARNTKEKFSKALGKTFKYNTFVRKGIAGDWKNYFTDKHIDAFNSIAGDAMRMLGYTV